MSTPPRLRQLFSDGDFIIAPGVYDMFSARISGEMNFKALHPGGYGVAGSHLGVPDAGLLTYADMVGRARCLARRDHRIRQAARSAAARSRTSRAHARTGLAGGALRR